jgi:hypothetical protein
MKKLFILSLCFMFFVQNVEAHPDLFCGHCCEHKRKCLAEKSAVEKKYKNETEQHNNCQEQYSNCQKQYSNCQAERDSNEFWRNFWIGFTIFAGFAASVASFAAYKSNEKNNDLTSANNLANRKILAQEKLIRKKNADLRNLRRRVGRTNVKFRHL